MLNEIADDLIESMPEVSENAIAEHQEQERKNQATIEQEENPAPVTSPAGLTYDPKTHMISPKTGKIIKKKASGKSKVVSSASQQASTQTGAPANTDLQARAAGKACAATIIALCVGVFGDEFVPEESDVKNERVQLENAYGDYFVATGRTDFPPSMALVISTGAYILPRLTQPKTRTKLAGVKDWVIGKFFSWRGKKTLEKARENAENN